MPRFIIPHRDGAHNIKPTTPEVSAHVLAVSPIGGTMGGSLSVETRAPGSTVFEAVQDSPIDLAAPKSLTFTFAVAEYRFTITTKSGSASQLAIQDTVGEL